MLRNHHCTDTMTGKRICQGKSEVFLRLEHVSGRRDAGEIRPYCILPACHRTESNQPPSHKKWDGLLHCFQALPQKHEHHPRTSRRFHSVLYQHCSPFESLCFLFPFFLGVMKSHVSASKASSFPYHPCCSCLFCLLVKKIPFFPMMLKPV